MDARVKKTCAIAVPDPQHDRGTLRRMELIKAMREIVDKLARYVVITSCAVVSISAQSQPIIPNSVQLTRDVVGQGHRYWENGFLAVRETEAPTVHLYDRSGKKLWTRTVSISGASTSGLLPAAIWPDGTTAVAGGARSPDGALAGFIAWIDTSGQITKVVRTTPFIAWYMTVTPDGNLWAFGRAFNPPGAKVDTPHQMVRSFSKDGIQLRESMQRDAFATWPHPTTEAGIAHHGDRIGLYLSRSSGWIELSAETGEEKFRTKVNQPASFRLKRAVYGPRGELYLSGSVSDQTRKRRVSAFAKVEPQSGKWTDLTPTLTAGELKGASIVGTDGRYLVLSSAGDKVYRHPMP